MAHKNEPVSVTAMKSGKLDDGTDDDGHHPFHLPKRTAIKKTGFGLFALSFQTLGIIYSDVGTSPVYTMNGLWSAAGPVPSAEDVIGGISAIVWALTIIPLIKYVFIALWFGTTEGEGGVFALYQGLYPLSIFQNTDTNQINLNVSQKKRIPPPFLRWPLLLWALFGVALTMADGVFTAAVSVTSAVGGIAVAKPSVSGSIIPISIGFLLVLFLAQPFGTHKLSVAFAPITGFWLLLIGGCGIANITQYPGIWRAYDPSRAILYFVRTKNYDLLAGVLLALTGCEAMFASLGHFNMRSIQISFSTVVYPCLIFAYLGQGARIIVDGEAVMSNIFYDTIPGSSKGALFWITYVFAILATLIASQTMITAMFSLVQQLINMKSLPPLRMHHTSNTIQGQVYIPAANWTLMVVTILITGVFKNSIQLSNAYGFAVSTVMFTTSMLITLQIPFVKQLPVIVAILYFVVYGFFDGLFWGASLKKVPEGAWVPLMIGAILWIIMVFWNWAKRLEDNFDGASRLKLDHFLVPSESKTSAAYDDDGLSGFPTLPASGNATLGVEKNRTSNAYDVQGDYGNAGERGVEDMLREATYYCMTRNGLTGGDDKQELGRLPIVGVFHKMVNEKGVPHSFISFVRQWPTLPSVVIFLTVHVMPVAHVSAHDRYFVEKVYSYPGVYNVTYCLGYRQEFEVEVPEIVNRVCALEARLNPKEAPTINKRINAYAKYSTHILPHYDIVSKKVHFGGALSPAVNYVRRVLIQEIYGRLCVLFPETSNWAGSSDEIIRIGVNAHI